MPGFAIIRDKWYNIGAKVDVLTIYPGHASEPLHCRAGAFLYIKICIYSFLLRFVPIVTSAKPIDVFKKIIFDRRSKRVENEVYAFSSC